MLLALERGEREDLDAVLLNGVHKVVDHGRRRLQGGEGVVVQDELRVVGAEVHRLDETGHVFELGSESAPNNVVGVGHALQTVSGYV